VALEIYVMPLQRYFRGAYEALSPNDGPPQEVCDEATARERVSTLQSDLSAASGCEVRWEDEGEVAMRRSIDARHLHALRSFAAHLEYPSRFLVFAQSFRVLDDPRDHKGLRKIYDGQPTTHEHLMRHSDDRGFYVPVDFPSPCTTSEAKWWKIGSTQRLHDELTRVESRFDDATPLLVRDTCKLLLEVCAEANQRGLPIVWQGR
jgi:hypothetical protein